MYERCEAGVQKALAGLTTSIAAETIRYSDLSILPNGIDDPFNLYEQIETSQFESLTTEVQQVADTDVEISDATMNVEQQVESATSDEKCHQQDTTTQFALAWTHLQDSVWRFNNAVSSWNFKGHFQKELGVRMEVSLGGNQAHDPSDINELHEKLLASQKKCRILFGFFEGNMKTVEHKFKSGVASLLQGSSVADAMAPALSEHSQNQPAKAAAS